MENTELTLEEKNCLRLWFRQAIDIVEMEEAKNSLLNFYAPEHGATHRVSPVHRRPARNAQPVHAKELAY